MNVSRRQWKPTAVDRIEADKKRTALVLQTGVRDPVYPSTQVTTVFKFDPGKPWTAHVAVANVLQSLTGNIRICDPYYGIGSLQRIAELTHCSSVKFLTRTADRKEQSFLTKAFQDFVREHPNVEFRLHAANDLHDRFILSLDELILVGHGLKDIGNKESFLVRLTRDLAGDMINSVEVAFDAKWKSGTAL